MKRIMLFTIVAFSVINCKKENIGAVGCGVNNPAEELPWLKLKIDDLQKDQTNISIYQSVKQGAYNGETVFFYGNCCPFCQTMFTIATVTVYKCDGTSISNIDPGKISSIKTVWKPQGYQCSDD